ncbi:metalloregulator ArsR/SmtB family transcription factor [Pontibacillus yanchengensis]|uniref:Metalloregulator ArsR/SmtB family transcription factor n=2 Tax=Pontibacillus yanchengensis TaxID=462910 RepID=A0A6I5A4Q2_9BACI|nr:metalloregulator ArsR/SmtB family transcription factor [Pontibacillus yanchengensis]MYL35306.1 metalloregulator ArsR/SmtB family transcription factor [Pontibacillus yanchengensis]MYL52335.1 metalloregulator ArsR/SmtB family transcription factor [Pontibacillus yanchengensis]
MQLDKVVQFHKVLGDPTRIRIVTLLKHGPLHGQAIANKLGLRPPTITHHVTKLRDAGLVFQRRDRNTIYFYLDEKKLEQNAKAILTMGEDTKMKQDMQVDEKEKLSIIKNFFAKDGSLKQIPSQRKKKLVVLAYLIRQIESGRIYEEKEINEIILPFHEDYATIRREWIMNHFMYRKNNQYELNPKEMWPLIF